jgi:hypothetical protein
VPGYVPAGWVLNSADASPQPTAVISTAQRLYAKGTSAQEVAAGIDISSERFEIGMIPPPNAPAGRSAINGHAATWYTSVGVRSVQWMFESRLQVAVHARGLSDAKLAEIASGVVSDRDGVGAAGGHLPAGYHLIAGVAGGRIGPPGTVIDYQNDTTNTGFAVETSAEGPDVLLLGRWAFPHLRPVTVRGHPGLFDQFSDSPLDPPNQAPNNRRVEFGQLIWQEKPGETVAIAFGGSVGLQTFIDVADSLHPVDDATWNALHTKATECRQQGTTSYCPSPAIPQGEGRLSGRLGPGAPPSGTVPNSIVLTFTSGRQVTTTAVAGMYQVDLPPGVWSVRSADGNLCATGLQVTAGGTQQDDLTYPLAGCQDLSGPPTPQAPPPTAVHSVG